VPATVFVGDVAGALAALIVRYEALAHHLRAWRAAVPAGRGFPASAAGGLLARRGEWGPGDRTRGAGALIRWLRESPDPGRPGAHAVAIAPGADGDRVIACAAGFTHLAVDHGAIEIIKRTSPTLLADPGRPPAGRPGHQPLDQAELEATPAERARADAGAGLPAGPVPAIPAACTRCLVPGPAASRWRWNCRQRSPRWRCGRWRRATRASRSSVVLAAVCAGGRPQGRDIGKLVLRWCQATASSAIWRATSAPCPRTPSPPSG